MSDQVRIDTIKGFIRVEERNLKRAEEQYRLLAFGIAGIKESLDRDMKRLQAIMSKEENTK